MSVAVEGVVVGAYIGDNKRGRRERGGDKQFTIENVKSLRICLSSRSTRRVNAMGSKVMHASRLSNEQKGYSTRFFREQLCRRGRKDVKNCSRSYSTHRYEEQRCILATRFSLSCEKRDQFWPQFFCTEFAANISLTFYFIVILL